MEGALQKKSKWDTLNKRWKIIVVPITTKKETASSESIKMHNYKEIYRSSQTEPSYSILMAY